MAVEIRQLVVKSNVLQRQNAEEQQDAPHVEINRQEILEECRRMIADALREAKDR